MTEIERAIKHFENMRDENYVVLERFKQEIESGNVNGSTILYDNRHLYYSLAIAALTEQADRSKGCEYCSGEYEEQKHLKRTGYGNFHDAYCAAYVCDAGAIEFELSSDGVDVEGEWEINYCPMCGRKLKEDKP